MTSNNTSEAHFLADLTPVSDDELRALRSRLARHAESAGMLDVAYRTMDSPVGTLLLAATTAGVVRIAYVQEGIDDVLVNLADRLSPRVLEDPTRLDEVARQLDEYFDRRRRTFHLPLDLSLSRGFRRQVVDYLPEIGYGRRASYSDVAAAVGNPRAARAVGTACATNPLALVVPCHRVVRSDGIIGAYGGGTDAKRFLLDLETPG